jgi:hypothetical protein
MIKVGISNGGGIFAKVTNNGELVTGPLEYSEPYYMELGVAAQIYSIVPGKANKRFLITGILLGADRNVATDCTINIYEATSAEGTADKEILTIDLNKGEHTFLNINVATQETRWINGTTDDDDVDVTIFGYYVN